MKKLLTVLSLCLATQTHAQLTPEEMLALQILLGQDNQQQPIHYYIPQQRQPNMSDVYNAYPNNPELYRYLERNPRYINYYLGR